MSSNPWRAVASMATLLLALACATEEPGVAGSDPPKHRRASRVSAAAPPPAEATIRPAIDHSPWAEFLDNYVWIERSGIHNLEYGSVEPEDREMLDRYLASLQEIAISEFPRAEQMAFWINLYNALTVDVILDHYPVASILEIDLTPPSDGPWDAQLARVEGRDLSLNGIEHEILRPTFGDPRIHYAVNCASYSCPNLAAEPFTPVNLEDLLDRSARDYVNHPRGARFEDGRLIVSSIYLWYREDFGDSDEGIVEHLQLYATGDLAEELANYSGELGQDYDWSLNEP